MTGRELMEQAMRLLNYTDPRGEIDRNQTGELFRRGRAMVNQLLADLLPIEGKEITRIDTLDDVLPVSDRTAMTAAPYGLAMLLAGSEGDGDNQQMMAAIYNQKRGSVRRPGSRVADRLPWPMD